MNTQSQTALPHELALIFAKGLGVLAPYFSRGNEARFSSWGPRNTEDWLAKYAKSASHPKFCHQEPWLTIVALYGLLGDQTDLGSQRRLCALNNLIDRAYVGKGSWAETPCFSRIEGAQAELCLPENLIFRSYLRNTIFADGAHHPYRDRRQIVGQKLSRKKASFEGNTNLDALISGCDEPGRPIHIFIEAKFLSDVSTHISYLPVRNQIARNIDCAIDLMTRGGSDPDGLQDFWFVLLTPGLFRTASYGGPVSTALDSFGPSRSRLFCYKMDDYLTPALLKQDLPHWEGVLEDSHWERISKRIGWLTFEDIVKVARGADILPPAEREAFCAFFADRGIA